MQKTIPYKPDHFYFLGSTVNQVIGFRAARGTGDVVNQNHTTQLSRFL
ncbi:hypothetical protein ISS312_03158 [Alteromonas mediterranea]|nr:hypothetical protein ISS312_03158 [Alteromonas mediterranea]